MATSPFTRSGSVPAKSSMRNCISPSKPQSLTSHQKITVAAESAPEGLDIEEMFRELQDLTVSEDRERLLKFLRRVAGMGLEAG
jgi:hypothetical protein